jgi:putative ATP-dependent endonuclease of OLD family
VALRELVVEGFRGIRSARLTLDRTTVVIGENDSGKSSLLEALALVLSPLGGERPRLEPWHFRRTPSASAADAGGRVRIEVTLAESRAGSWDRPGLEALAPILGPSRGTPRILVVELRAVPAAGEEPVSASFEVRSPDGGRPSRDNAAVLAAVRCLNPLLWMRHGVLVESPARGAPEDTAPISPADALPAAADVLRSYERLVARATPSEDLEIESGYAAAERLLAQWAPDALARRPGARAAVAEILGRALEPAAAAPAAKARPAGSIAQKLGVFVLTARLFEQLRGTAAPGVRPIIAVEEPEAGLHPMTLASVWSLLERLDTQKIVTTHSGSLLAAAPLRSLRRLVRDADGTVREWRVGEGALRKDELRKVSYHLRARRGAACFARCWLLVEGETEYWLLPDLARLVGHDLVQEGIACVEFAQCGLAPLIKLAGALGIEWHVLTDGDRAGDAYAQAARSLLRGEDPALRLSRLAERDVESCFWHHGHARVFERLAGLRAGPRASPRRVIEKAIERHSKPGVAFELLASVAGPGSAGAPPPLRRAIETCVALARGPRPSPRGAVSERAPERARS